LYAPAHNEVDTGLILREAFQAGKRVLFPAVCGHHIVFRRVEHLEPMQEGAYGILEPCPRDADHHSENADLVIVPGIMFDLSGHRIGYGKGFYDRYFHQNGRRAHLVGLCHDFQLTDRVIPADVHDIPMDIVVSETRIVRITRSGAGK
jgi:5-formyltetrahydrofolate cyclo-ligase